MNERSVDLVKAYELISGGKLNKNGKNEINWFALKEEFINEELEQTLKVCLLLHKIWLKTLKKNFKVAKLKLWQLSIN